MVVRVFCDNDVSAYSGKPRPEYIRIMAMLTAGKADVVLCWHTDRLHRSNAELEDYIDVVEPRDITTETVKAGMIDLNTPVGRMVARQLCTIARYESEHRAERVAVARERQARTGKFGGGRRPYGFEADGVTVIPDEAAVIVRMADAVMSGVPLRSVARDLRMLGILTASGVQWTPEGVRDARMERQDILSRPKAPKLWYVLSEGVLRQCTGGAEVIGGQLDKLIKAAETPGWIVQILPFSAQANAGIDGLLYLYERPSVPVVAYCETYGGARLIEDQAEVSDLTTVMGMLRAAALPPWDFVAFMRTIRRDLD